MITLVTLPYFPKYYVERIYYYVSDNGKPEQNSKFLRRTLKLSILINNKDYIKWLLEIKLGCYLCNSHDLNNGMIAILMVYVSLNFNSSWIFFQ